MNDKNDSNTYVPKESYQKTPTHRCDINLVVSASGVLHHNIMNSSGLELSYKYAIQW